ncbi:MAG: siroheme decarboxylase subunit beta, partial [Solirubrobacterales bacterium]
ERLGTSQDEVLRRLASLQERDGLRRVAAILYHRRAGFSANGMGVWKVAEDEVLDTGRRMAAFRGVSHCYQRPTYADWPYSVFTMAHGRSKEECDAILDGIADEHGLYGDDRAVLYSSTEFKKIRLHYFTPDYADWEAQNS